METINSTSESKYFSPVLPLNVTELYDYNNQTYFQNNFMKAIENEQDNFTKEMLQIIR